MFTWARPRGSAHQRAGEVDQAPTDPPWLNLPQDEEGNRQKGEECTPLTRRWTIDIKECW